MDGAPGREDLLREALAEYERLREQGHPDPLAEVLGRIGWAPTCGRRGPCPLHQPDATPSSWIWEANGHARLICGHGAGPDGIGHHGPSGFLLLDALDLEAHRRGLSGGRALSELAAEMGIAAPEPEKAKGRCRNGTWTSETEDRPAQSPALVDARDVKPEAISWLWPGRLAKGKLAIMAGRPSAGKSCLTADIAARISSGTPWPDGSPCLQGHVVIASLEDGVADTLVPRLRSAGADLSDGRVMILSHVDVDGREESLSLNRHLATFEQVLARPGLALLILDPLDAMLGGIDTHRSADLRSALAPLCRLASKHGVALLIVHHLRKGGQGTALDRLSGSLAIGAAARTVLLAVRDPDQEDARYLAVIKSNIAREAPTLGYSLEGDGESAPRVEWAPGTADVDVLDLLAAAEGERRRDRGTPAVDEARTWLLAELANGPVAVRFLYDRARSAGISKAALRRAKEEIGDDIRTFKPSYSAGWVWGLGSPEEGAHEDDEGAQLHERREHLRQNGHGGPVPAASSEGAHREHLRGSDEHLPEGAHLAEGAQASPQGAHDERLGQTGPEGHFRPHPLEGAHAPTEVEHLGEGEGLAL